MKKINSQSGFTLVELAIVLVLIGLIIGGVLKGQELIKSTRIKMAVSQWETIKAASHAFEDKFYAYPGDYEEASKYIYGLENFDNGDGNGIIGKSFGDIFTSAPITEGNLENSLFWKHLQSTDLIRGAENVGGREIARYLMPSRIVGAYLDIVYGGNGTGNNLIVSHWLRLRQGTADKPTDDVLSEREAAEIDQKYDDGVSSTGSIRAGSATGASCNYNISNITSASSLGSYKTCTLIMELR